MSMTPMSGLTNGKVQVNGTSGPSVGTAAKSRPKRVEVRWLESESEMYLKQWQHRYHQLVGLDIHGYHPKSGPIHGCHPSHEDFMDDWIGSGSPAVTAATAKTLLDLDLDFDAINGKNLISNSGTDSNGGSLGAGGGGHTNGRPTITTFDHIFWSTDDHHHQHLVKSSSMKNNYNNNKSNSNKRLKKSVFGVTASGHTVPTDVVRRRRPTGSVQADDDDEDGSASDGEENDDSFENIRFTSIKRFVSKNSNNNNNNKKYNRNKNEIVFGEKERQFSLDLNKRLELLAKDQALNGVDASIDEAILKARQPKSRQQRDRTRPPRPRPPPIRRQIFKCEHIGCSYQSDRNFNFLRHKRTHRKAGGGDDTVTANGVKVLTNLCVAVKSVATKPVSISPPVITLADHPIITCNGNPKLYLTQSSHTSDTTSSSIVSTLSVTTSGSSCAGSTTSADDLNALLLLKTTTAQPLLTTTAADTGATIATVNCLNTCDNLSEDTIKVIINNNNNNKINCENNIHNTNHNSYQQNSCLD